MKIVKRIEVGKIGSIDPWAIAEKVVVQKEGDKFVLELIIEGEPLEELKEEKEEKKSKPKAWGKGELKWEPVEDPRFKEDTIKLTYLSDGKSIWSKYISKRQLDELYERLPEKTTMAEVFELAKEIGLGNLRGLGSHFLKFLTQFYPLKVERVSKKGGGFFYRLVKENTESLGEGAYYRCHENVVEIRCGSEVICPTWEQLRQIFDKLPEEATVSDIQKACEEVIGSVSFDTALTLAKFFDRRSEFDAELRHERGSMVLVKGAESEKYGEDLKAKFKLESDLLK